MQYLLILLYWTRVVVDTELEHDVPLETQLDDEGTVTTTTTVAEADSQMMMDDLHSTASPSSTVDYRMNFSRLLFQAALQQ